MGVLLQAAYRQRQGVSVPSPADGDATVPWWWDHLAGQANAFRLSGFSAVLLPPVLKTSAGASPGADGYGPFDDYDIGSKDQFGSVPTRFGSREQLQRCVAVMRANGLDVYLDVVPHQRDGGRDFVYRYRAADGSPSGGRFPKHAECFVPNVPRDPIPGPIADDFPFGDELAPVNARPPGYVMHGLIDAGDWLTRALDVQGYRIDDVKGLAVEFVRRWLGSKAMAGGFAVGEFYDGNPQTLNSWVWDSGMAGRCAAFDFALRFSLAAMCNDASRWDMSQLDHAGLAGLSPASAVTFVDNPDTDLSSPVVSNKLLGYAYILTSEGYPCVYYQDYSTDPGCYGLKPFIDNLIWIHENLAFGPTIQRWKDFQAFVFERQGHPGLLVGLNNDPWSGSRTVPVQTSFGPNVRLHDYTGRGADVWTDASGLATIAIPANDNGRGYVADSRPGYGNRFAAVPHYVTQVVEGAHDLDIGPLANGAATDATHIWCAAGSTVEAAFAPLAVEPTPAAQVAVEIVDERGTVVGSQHWTAGGSAAAPLRVAVHTPGRHAVRLAATGLAASLSFRLSLTYMAPQIVAAETPAGRTALVQAPVRGPRSRPRSSATPRRQIGRKRAQETAR